MLWLSQPTLRFARTPALLLCKATTSVPPRVLTSAAQFHHARRHFESEKKPPRSWTSEEVDLLFNLRKENYAVNDIAIILQRSHSSVATRLNTHRSTAGKAWKPWSKQEDDELRTVMAEVVTAATKNALAGKLSRTPHGVDNRLQILRRQANLPKKIVTNKSPRPWSQSEHDLARRLRDEGKSYKNISEALGRTSGSVRGLFHRLRLYGKPSNSRYFISDDERATIELLDSQGLSRREILQLMATHRGSRAVERVLYALPNRKPRITLWTEEETIKLRKLYYEGKMPAEMLPYLPGRTAKACEHKVQQYRHQREKR